MGQPHIPLSQSSDPSLRKRRHPSTFHSLEIDADCAVPKKRKIHHPAFPPRKFWEELSETHLTRNALQAFNEQNSQVPDESAKRSTPRRRPRSGPRSILDAGNQLASRIVNTYSSTSLKRLKAFARHGGPDLSDLRRYPISNNQRNNMSSVQSSLGRRKRGSQSPTKRSSQSPTKGSNTPRTTSTKSTGPYDRAFQQHLIDHDILPHGYEYPDGRLPKDPDNMDEIRKALAQPRASLSPSKFSNEDFRKFERADAQASKEREVTTNVIPIIQGDNGDKKCVAGEIPFTNLEHLTDGTLVPGNPDLYYGSRPEQLHKAVRGELSNYVVPSTQHDLPIVPNYLFQAKGPDGSLSVATRQASYDGALGARGIHRLQSYKQPEPQYDNNAYTLTSIYHGGQLKMYTTHPIPPVVTGGQPGFVMTQIKTWGMTGDADTFRQGAAAFRNGRDWAKRERDKAIKEANDRVAHDPVSITSGDALGSSFGSDVSACDTIVTSQETILNPPPHGVPIYESETSADELSLDHPPRIKRTKSPQKKPFG
ncbi:hypothetical protein ED733_000958 [Metarhizium rileyi]|uniref:Uncharacterized protein n=1 Tax=Metarhizium rileyi (strain RCEF 4871) TaxID=1649241 RepID=A0A5C6G243_METRR|nr:hypothetical protein ED733_000958 [Metarhizium rileyi]